MEGNVECTYMKANRNAMIEWMPRETDSEGSCDRTDETKRNPAEIRRIFKSIFNSARPSLLLLSASVPRMSAAHRGSHPGGSAAPTQQQQPAFTASEVFRGTSLGDALETSLFELEDARLFPDSVHDFAMRAFDQVQHCVRAVLYLIVYFYTLINVSIVLELKSANHHLNCS